jgi:hypothetical protein
MMSPIKTLTDLMSPPTKPSDPPTPEGWDEVEAALGFKLPGDYKQFVSTFGTGAVDGFLWVLNPFSRNPHLNLIEDARSTLSAEREFAEEAGPRIPYPLYPDANGLFPWGGTDNGDVLYWLRTGDPTAWSVVVRESRGPDWCEYKMSTTEFLACVLTRDIICDIFPDDFPSDAPRFVVPPRETDKVDRS